MKTKNTNSVNAVRTRNRTPKYPCRLSVYITEEQYNFLREIGLAIEAPSEFGAPCRGVKKLIDEAMNNE